MNETATTADRPAANGDRAALWPEAALDAMAKEMWRLNEAEARADLSALRRMNPDQPTEPALFRLLARCVPDDLGGRPDELRRYALAALIMAQRPDALRKGSLGQSLQHAGFSDQRLAMLLNARGATFRDLARRTARRLTGDAEAAGLAYLELCTLALLDERPSHDRTTENMRIRIASDFQRAAQSGR